MDWTEEQKQAIYEKDSNILVAAAAGSGKTAVLVERIINKIVNEEIDIDKILVVTFTNAAASEMRERILDAIYKKLEENPDSTNLQRQINLLNKASICTIHSFCLDVIRNNFYEIDTSANFRIADTAEIELLKSEVIEELFEQKYTSEDAGFLKLLNTYTGYRGDESLIELVLNIYKYIQSSPFPEKWLEEKIKMLDIEEDIDFSKTIWGNIILEEAKSTIKECIMQLERIKDETLKWNELEKYSNVLIQDIQKLRNEYESCKTWDDAYNTIDAKFEKWPIDKKVTISLKNEAKDIVDKVKKQIGKITLPCNSKEAIQDIKYMYEILKELQKLVQEFSILFADKKKEKNIVDFNDIEHFALNILVQNKENTIVPSEVAKNYMQKFSEIAIDEYQDSNLVQEYILNSISNGKNMFMVGDVKQSIYKFRQARPELFLEKYDTYDLKNKYSKDSSGLKIKLFKNFRSRQNILDLTNFIFENIMTKELGNVEYTKEEYLNYGANYPKPEGKIDNTLELNIIDLKEEDDFEEETQQEEERIEDSVLEARFVAKKIKELLQSDYIVFDKKQGYRKITYKDICVLLRATSVLAPIYEKEILDAGLPVFSDTSTTYLDSMEVQIVMSLLKIIDNPMQDIPLVTILRSSIGNFNDDELIQIRLSDKNSTFYEALLKSRLVVNGDLKKKIEDFIENLDKWKKQAKYLPLDEFIWKLYMDTGFYHYVSLLTNGSLRQANLKLLFEKAKQYESASLKGLFNFINFIDKVKSSGGDAGSAKLIGENENVIRIMSIHKSKGLEFPVVFLCGTGKKFNLQDLNEPILLHQDKGFGPKFIDDKRKVEYNTLAREAIRINMKKETISEEMRVLYVALTRAKEKLVITGMSKDLQKSLKEKEELLNIYGKIEHRLVEKYPSYLDWLELVYLNDKDKVKDILTVKEFRKNELLKEQVEEKEDIDIKKFLQQDYKDAKDELNENIYSELKWQYPYIASSKIPTKTSVTKLKQMEDEDQNTKVYDIEDLIDRKVKEKVSITFKPKFIENKQSLSPAQKGTLMHLCVQKLDESKDYTKEDIEKMIETLYEKQIITQIEKESVDIDVLYNYTKSELWQELKQAKEVCKEKPFYINVPAKAIYEDANEKENILVQGIIDLYYISKDDKLILVDFKTDHVSENEKYKLEEKYKVQLELYKKALEEALEKKVDKAEIYALS